MNNNYVASEGFLFYNQRIYASDMCRNGLFVYDYSENKGQFAGLFPDEECDSFRMHSNAHFIEDKIWFIPDRGKHIHIVNPDSNLIDSDIKMIRDENVRTEYSFYINRKIVLFQNNNIIRSFSTTDYDSVDIEIPVMSAQAHLRRDISVEGKNLFFVNNIDQVVYKFDTQENKIEIIKIEGIDNIPNGFGTILKKGDVIWLSTQRGIIKYNLITKESKLFDCFPDNYGMRIINSEGSFQIINGFVDVNNNGEQPFFASIIWNNRIILFAGRVNTCIQIDLESEKLEEFRLADEIEDEDSLKQRGRVTHNHYILRSENGVNYITSTKTRRIYVFDDSGSYHYHCIPYNEPEWTFEAGKGIAMEFESGLSDFLEYISR